MDEDVLAHLSKERSRTMNIEKKKWESFEKILVVACMTIFPMIYILQTPLQLITKINPVFQWILPIVIVGFLSLFSIRFSIRWIWASIRPISLLLVYVIYTAVTVFWSPDKMRGSLFVVFLFLSIFLALYLNSCDRANVWCIGGYILGIGLSNVLLMQLTMIPGGYYVVRYPRFGYLIGIVSLNPNVWGFFLCVAIAFLLIGLDTQRERGLLYLLLSIMSIFVFFTESRSFIVVMFSIYGSYCAYRLFYKRDGLRKNVKNCIKTMSCILIPILLISVMNFIIDRAIITITEDEKDSYDQIWSDIHLAQELSNQEGPVNMTEGPRILQTDANINGRITIWTESLSKMFKSTRTALLGVGAGGSEIFTAQAIRESGKGKTWESADTLSPHNIYLALLFEGGIVGFLLLFLAFIQIVHGICKRKRTIYLLSFAPVILGGITTTLQTSPAFILCFGVAISQAVSLPETKKEENR